MSVQQASAAMAPIAAWAKAGGWSHNRNVRVREAPSVTMRLRDFATASLTLELHEYFEGEASEEEALAENQKTLEALQDARGLLAFLEKASRVNTPGIPAELRVELLSQFAVAIARMKDIVATLSYVSDQDDYQRLGFEAVPKVKEPPVPDLTDLFEDAS